MRLLGRLTALVLILLLSWPIAKSYLLASFEWFGESTDNQRPDLPDEADQETVFWLDSERWIRFRLTDNASTLRILAHLQLLPEQADTEENPLYGFAYRLLDASGEEIHSSEHYFRAAVLPPRTLDDGREFPARFYDDSNRVASAGENLFFRLGEAESAVALEIRAVNKPVPENRVGVQVSYEETRQREDASRLWPRLAPETRQRLLRSHAYPPHLVSSSEIENALMSRWMPLRPEEVSGADFLSDYLYTLEVPPPPPKGANDVLPSGLYADQSHWVTVPIHEQGNYRIEIEPVDTGVTDFTVNVGHQRNADLEVWQSVLNGKPPILVWTGKLGPGLLQVIPNVPVVVRLFDGDTGVEQTPDANYLRADEVSAGTPVGFKLDPGNNSEQPVRLDLRTFVHPERPDSGPEPTIELRVKDRHGAVLKQFRKSINPPVSYYQRFSGELPGSRVSEAEHLFLHVPESAAELMVVSDTPVLVTGYARLNELPLVRNLPDERRPWQDRSNRMPSWFLMKPMESSAPAQRVALQWFFQPIERNPAIASGRYDWQALEPSRTSPLREVLFPHQLTGPLRQAAVGSVYRALTGQPLTLELVAPGRDIPFRPELIYRRTDPAPETVTIRRNGEVWLRRGIAGRTGRFSLPVVDAGRYTVEVEASGQWYLNHNRPPEGKGYLQRSFYTLGSSGQEFVLDKVAPREVVNLDVVAPQGSESLTITVRVVNAARSKGLLTDYSFLERRYEIQVNERKTLLLGTQSDTWASPITVGVPLGDDLPPGRYRISVTAGTSGGLVSAYTVREGKSQSFRFFRRSLDGY